MTDPVLVKEILRYRVQLEVIQAQVYAVKQQLENGLETIDRERNRLDKLIEKLNMEDSNVRT